MTCAMRAGRRSTSQLLKRTKRPRYTPKLPRANATATTHHDQRLPSRLRSTSCTRYVEAKPSNSAVQANDESIVAPAETVEGCQGAGERDPGKAEVPAQERVVGVARAVRTQGKRRKRQ